MTFKKLKHLKKEEQEEFFADSIKVEKLVRKTLSKKRADHSVSVARTAAMLAKTNGIDEDKAYLAGLLHDITKEKDSAYHKKVLKKFSPDKLNYPQGTYHSYTGAYYLRDFADVIGQDVVDAVYNHTIIEEKNALNMILFIADKREPLRKIKDDILEMAENDLESAYDKLCADVTKYLTNRGKDERIIKTGV